MNQVTKELIEAQIQANLGRIKVLPVTTLDDQGQVIIDPEREILVKETAQLIDKLEAGERLDADVVKTEEDQRIREEESIRRSNESHERLEFDKAQAERAELIRKLEMALEKDKLQQNQQQFAAEQIQKDRHAKTQAWNEFFGKGDVPLATAAIGVAAYFVAQEKVFDFEEHGRLTSTPARELKLPKLPGFK